VSDGDWRIDGERATRLAQLLLHFGFGRLDGAQNFACAGDEDRALVGEVQPPRVAVNERHLQVPFEVAHAGRHGCIGKIQGLGGTREAAAFGHTHEHLHCPQSVHSLFSAVDRRLQERFSCAV
jgi:hypothetical protein